MRLEVFPWGGLPLHLVLPRSQIEGAGLEAGVEELAAAVLQWWCSYGGEGGPIQRVLATAVASLCRSRKVDAALVAPGVVPLPQCFCFRRPGEGATPNLLVDWYAGMVDVVEAVAAVNVQARTSFYALTSCYEDFARGCYVWARAALDRTRHARYVIGYSDTLFLTSHPLTPAAAEEINAARPDRPPVGTGYVMLTTALRYPRRTPDQLQALRDRVVLGYQPYAEVFTEEALTDYGAAPLVAQACRLWYDSDDPATAGVGVDIAPPPCLTIDPDQQHAWYIEAQLATQAEDRARRAMRPVGEAPS